MDFFSTCGPIAYCRMAGDESHPARFAFLEFETVDAAQAAMKLSGTVLLDRPIRYS
jgi:arginine/serine-rich splicing factor 12